MGGHFEEVRFSAAKETADPSGFLMCLAPARQKRREDLDDAIRVLTLAYKCGQLAAKLLLHICIGGLIRDARLAVIDERFLGGISKKNVFDQH